MESPITQENMPPLMEPNSSSPYSHEPKLTCRAQGIQYTSSLPHMPMYPMWAYLQVYQLKLHMHFLHPPGYYMPRPFQSS